MHKIINFINLKKLLESKNLLLKKILEIILLVQINKLKKILIMVKDLKFIVIKNKVHLH
jgi:hypothetical protein